MVEGERKDCGNESVRGEGRTGACEIAGPEALGYSAARAPNRVGPWKAVIQHSSTHHRSSHTTHGSTPDQARVKKEKGLNIMREKE